MGQITLKDLKPSWVIDKKYDKEEQIRSDFDANQKRILKAIKHFESLKAEHMNLQDLIIFSNEWEKIAFILETLVANTASYNKQTTMIDA